jgi:hypothetical protein
MQNKSLQWQHCFPYDVVRDAGITPHSSMADIKKAALLMLGPNLTPQIRDALTDLRLVKRRLFVDFFLYQVEGEVATAALLEQQIKAAIEAPATLDLSPFLTPGTLELEHIDQAFQDIQYKEVGLEYLDFQQEEIISADAILFDA